jgi:5'-3' exonuclease
MGIPSYFSYIVRQHRTIIRPYLKNEEAIDNLYLDANSIIYDAVQKEDSIRDKVTGLVDETKLIAAVCEKICYYIRLIGPTQKVFIAFDGVAPIAKMNQQRNRRYMSLLLDDQAQQQAQAQQAQAQKAQEPHWNTSAITPGTAFMQQLSSGIQTRFFQKEKEFGLNTLKISTAEEAGEGEHKIYEYIRENKAYHGTTKTIIYGLDADLIMLTLNHLHISAEMYLFRETPHFIQHIDKTLNPNAQYLMNIKQFGDAIIRELSAQDIQKDTSQDIVNGSENKIFDYIFICFLLGNDFLPHFPALNIRTNGITYLMNAYKHVFSSASAINLTSDKGTVIVWKNVRKFIEYLSVHELTYIQGEYKKRDRMSKFAGNKREEDEDDTLTLPMKERSIEKYINPFEKGWETRYYKTLFEGKITEQTKKEICLNYLAGLEWTMKYYTTGCVDWRWNYKAHYPPLLADLIQYVPYFETCFVPRQLKNPVLPLVQLCYVLPERSLNLLPAKLKQSLVASYPAWYTSDCDLKWSFCKYLWEAHATLPEIDIGALEKLIAKNV